MIATVDNPSNAAEWALAEMVNRLVSLLSVLPQLKFWASYATGHILYRYFDTSERLRLRLRRCSQEHIFFESTGELRFIELEREK